jgi:hypothetical protein
MQYLGGLPSTAHRPAAVWRPRWRRSLRQVLVVAAAAVAVFGLLVATANAQVGRVSAG